MNSPARNSQSQPWEGESQAGIRPALQQPFQDVLADAAQKIQTLQDLNAVLQYIASQTIKALRAHKVLIMQGQVGSGYRIWAEVVTAAGPSFERDLANEVILNAVIPALNQPWGMISVYTSSSKTPEDGSGQCTLLDSAASQEFLHQLSIQIAIAVQQSTLAERLRKEQLRRIAAESSLVIANQELKRTATELTGCNLSKSQLVSRLVELERTKQIIERENAISLFIAELIQKIRYFMKLDEILQTTVAEVQKVLRADRIVIYQVSQEGAGRVISEAVAPEWPSLLGFEFPEETFPLQYQQELSAYPYKAVQDAEAIYRHSAPCMLDFLNQWRIKTKVMIPILQQTRVWGFLIVHQCAYCREWTPFELDLLSQVSAPLAIAIQQSELHPQLQAELNEYQKTEAYLK